MPLLRKFQTHPQCDRIGWNLAFWKLLKLFWQKIRVHVALKKFEDILTILMLGHGGGGHVVSMLTFYSDDPCSNPAEVYNLFGKMCVRKEWNGKRGRGWPIKNNLVSIEKFYCCKWPNILHKPSGHTLPLLWTHRLKHFLFHARPYQCDQKKIAKCL